MARLDAHLAGDLRAMALMVVATEPQQRAFLRGFSLCGSIYDISPRPSRAMWQAYELGSRMGQKVIEADQADG